MKIIILFFLSLHTYIHACTLCATEVPQVIVNTHVSYNEKETFFDIEWKFHKEFVNSLTQYDLNENGIFEKEEQNEIKKSLVVYLKQFHFLTDIKYSAIDKITQVDFIENIEPILSTLEFKNDSMNYFYKFSLPFVLKNNHSLFVGFSDNGDNFAFSINNVTVNNYPNAYLLKKKLVNTTIILDDDKIPSSLSNGLEETIDVIQLNKKEGLEETTLIGILSENLMLLKENLKTTLISIKENNDTKSYMWLLIFSFLYGILHAIGPGHGKSLVSSYFLNQNKSYLKAFSISSLIGIVHTFSAFILTLVVYYSVGFIFNSVIINIEKVTTQISAIIIIGIALYLIFKKLRTTTAPKLSFSAGKPLSPVFSVNNTIHTNTLSCACNSCKTTSTDMGVILAAGIIPCPGTVTIFLFTISIGVYFVGFMSALFMSAGMSLIIFITAILSVKIRKSSSQNKTILKILEYGSLAFILFLGVLLLVVS